MKLKLLNSFFAVLTLSVPVVGKSLTVGVDEGGKLACAVKLSEAIFAEAIKESKKMQGLNPIVFEVRSVQYNTFGDDEVTIEDSQGKKFQIKFKGNYTWSIFSSRSSCWIEPGDVESDKHLYKIIDISDRENQSLAAVKFGTAVTGAKNNPTQASRVNLPSITK